ncbi:N(5)-(carboxyethyl)ornithine synthase [Arthrobacter sp. zg-Y820]|uniref:N(5)-(carboxyethyl)ornithine synthase n=1 Tax=unclassified Arthrobacter TaxID=235627 RepID=UPI001E324DD9|nr:MULTISPECIES: N(5)-(carboxyethyl)ornithine synthase [unclassified Arthrobacter]MCC9196543.1 N(5)-(carboxyethyl)ornithine synthase [Arthrobacter sp. zg-Y820]MDK1279405.1 N(5)-(carboxyethyl)ornithine synthase [Arthrobacter sp. zg.Y820]WIB08214.1 N(5)-(carboxyethyl)ornithine synthase [Arthrobacter sp. zg-Y820]
MSGTATDDTLMTLGVIGTSRKTDERRLPLHPRHLERIDADVRERMILEQGYGERFGFADAQLAPLVARLAPRSEVMAASDVVLLPKPQAADLQDLSDGQILWGWPHCVQDPLITQLAVDKSLTLIAFEAMNHWTPDGGFGLHVFHKNNELAGYSSVLHALELAGSTGDYGRRLTAVVIGFGATARGAVTALKALGIHDVQVLTNRETAAVGSPIHSARILRLERDDDQPHLSHVVTDDGPEPLAQFLAGYDLVVNCTLQDPNAPLTYLQESDLAAFAPGSLIIDVSCDEGMGFSWAKPTSFAEPVFAVGAGILYYAVDHSPSHLWDSATWEISEAVLPFLRTVMSGPAAWDAEASVARAIEIRNGRILNPAILAFQGRSADYPHTVTGG